jgi:hypothetical protein
MSTAPFSSDLSSIDPVLSTDLLLDADMPLGAWDSAPIAAAEEESSDWGEELLAGVTARSPERVIRALSHLSVLPSPPDTNDKLSLMSVRYFHPEIVTALRQAKLSYGAGEVSRQIFRSDDPDTFLWFVKNMAPVATALGLKPLREARAADVSPECLLPNEEAFRGMAPEWHRVHHRVAHLLLAEWIALERAAGFPALPEPMHLSKYSGKYSVREHLSGILAANLPRWITQSLNAVACTPDDLSGDRALTDFLALVRHLNPGQTATIFAESSSFYGDMSPKAISNLQTYLSTRPEIRSWVKATAARAVNKFKIGYFGSLGPLLANQLGWKNTRFGQSVIHGSQGLHQVAYAEVHPHAASSSLLDCLLLLAPGATNEQFLRLPGAAPALRQRLSDDRAGFVMTLLLRRHGMNLSDMDLFRGWTDSRGNTLAHYLFAFRASQGSFSKTSAVTMAREHAESLLVENAVGVTPLGLIPPQFAAIVERTLLRKTVRSTQRPTNDRAAAASPHRRKM